jgi:uncharacterized protein YnzC (UPF0291/DUF896 family)
MSSDTNVPETVVNVEVDPPTTTSENTPMTEGMTELKHETQALMDAIHKRALAESQAAGEFTRETYLKAIRQVRETVEQTKLIDPEQIEKSIETLQKDAEKNWQSISQEVQALGDRLSEAAKAAWTVLFPPKEDSSDS